MKDENSSKIYYPFCNEKDCDGILSITINDNFSINYQCDKNENHKNNNIYFKTFERFYLKEKNILKCSKCNMVLENDIRYECKLCSKIFCCSCFIKDEHIKNNIDNLILINNKCSVHQKDISLYCKKCKKHLCIFCIKEDENNIHQGHQIEYLNKIIPSINDTKQFMEKIKEKKKIYNEYIALLDEWRIKINNKIEQYQKNLINKISLMEKMFSNFNKFFNNYSYYNNFNRKK